MKGRNLSSPPRWPDHILDERGGCAQAWCVWQVHLAHFGGLIWPTRSCRFCEHGRSAAPFQTKRLSKLWECVYILSRFSSSFCTELSRPLTPELAGSRCAVA
jgi:hypothetical protein